MGIADRIAAAKPEAVAVFGRLDEASAALLVDETSAEADEFAFEREG